MTAPVAAARAGHSARNELIDGPGVTVVAEMVSIGLVTYNGERFLRGAIDALLAQDYPNLEILVSDNASTDGTRAICESFADRIRYVRQPENIGAAANFRYVLEQTSGPLFMWAADDDEWSPQYVSACMAALEPRAVLATTGIRFVDETGETVHLDATYQNVPVRGSVQARARTIMERSGWYAIYGLIRRDALERVTLEDTFGADVLALLQLATQGPFAHDPRPLFTYRTYENARERPTGSYHGLVTAAGEIVDLPWPRPGTALRYWLDREARFPPFQRDLLSG